MKVLIFDNEENATRRVADFVLDTVTKEPNSVLGLATGGTMLALYALLCRKYHDGLVSFSDVTTFNLDEYIGLNPEHPCSYHHYMRNAFFDHVDINLSNTKIPYGNAADPSEEAKRYESQIAQSNGIDLQLLGIGQNGHIGFNEPTSSLASRTRIKTLTESTRQANKVYFDSLNEAPKYSITMGIATILEARNLVLLATGVSKSAAVSDMIEGPISASCPASALQMHPSATIVLDQEAASQLKLTSYYHNVHPQGSDSAFD
ncbi:glucosamine-6-phosphate deaminase [Ahrensia sp. 13_GOM-1096m]|uniref:glucosamine-6-phosphate deaminase n=1 Tax=Ahrensia sp. 13_GOM-1096m TaxID=1380380 RepID=UPI000478EFD1|nr:glucosamine-6-phosphate deaminase [Ahrensia sp. 13_GOM-1096m]